MARIRHHSAQIVHQSLSHTIEEYLESSSFGTYGLIHGMYHLATLRDGERIWNQSRLEDWYYQQYKRTTSIDQVFHTHQLALSHFVAQQGEEPTDDPRLCALILQSEQLQNSSEEWLKRAIEEYRDGVITVEMIFQIISYLPVQSWFECVELLISVEVDLQMNTHNGRLNNVRKMLELLQSNIQADACEKYIPLTRIGWYAERICELWPEVSITELLNKEQMDALCKHPAHFDWLSQHGFISQIHSFENKLYNSNTKEALEWMDAVSDNVVLSWIESLYSKHSSVSDHYRNPWLFIRWLAVFTGLERLSCAGVDISSDLWSYWVDLSHQISPSEQFLDIEDEELLDEDMRSSRRRFFHRRKFNQIGRWLFDVPDTLLQSIYQRLSLEPDFEEDNDLMESIQRALSESPVASSNNPLDVLRDAEELEPAFSAWTDAAKTSGIEEEHCEKIVHVLQEKSLSIEQQDEVFSIIFPTIQDEVVPNKYVFAYLFVMQDNHSSDIVEQLKSHFERYFSIDWIVQIESEDFMTGRNVLDKMQHLIERLSHHKQYDKCIEIFKYIRAAVDLDIMEIHRTNMTNRLVLTPLLWHDCAWTCRLIEQSKVPYGKPEAFLKELQGYIGKIVEHVMSHPHLWSQMHTILQWRFFFEHPMMGTLDKIEGDARVLSTLFEEQILHMMPKFSVHLLEMLLAVPLIDRFPVMSQRTRSILKMVQKHKLIPQNGSLYNPEIAECVEKLLHEAKQMSDDLMRQVSILCAVRFARFFDVQLNEDVVLPEEKKVDKNPAIIELYRDSDVNDAMIDALIQSSKSNFEPFMHCKRMVEVLENPHQPDLLRSCIQQHLMNEVVEWSNKLGNTAPNDLSLVRAYGVLMGWFDQSGLEEESMHIQAVWNAQCDSMDYQVLLVCYAVSHRTEGYPTIMLSSLQSNQLKSTILDTNWQIPKQILEFYGTEEEQVSELSIWQYLLVLYQNDDEAFYACLKRLISVMHRLNVDWSEVVPHVPRISDIFMTQSSKWLQVERVHPLVTFLKHIPERKEVFMTWLNSKSLSEPVLLKVYVRLLDSELNELSVFNQVYDYVYPNSELQRLIPRMQHLITEQNLTLHAAQLIASKCVFEESNWVQSYKEYIEMMNHQKDVDLFDSADVNLLRLCIDQHQSVRHLVQAIQTGLLSLQDVADHVKSSLPKYLSSTLRHLSLMEPAKIQLHRGIVLSLLMQYAKQTNQVMVDQIFETCPELLSA